MYDDLIDHDRVRARVEKRLEPRLSLMRQRNWLLLHIVVFVALALLFATSQSNAWLYAATIHDVPSYNMTDPMTQQVVVMQGFTYTTYEPYLLVSLMTLIWPIVLLFHLLRYWSRSRRERIIEKEMGRELELETIRLQIELERARQGISAEKVKRDYGFGDDVEIVDDEDAGYKTSRLRL